MIVCVEDILSFMNIERNEGLSSVNGRPGTIHNGLTICQRSHILPTDNSNIAAHGPVVCGSISKKQKTFRRIRFIPFDKMQTPI